jgi:hypothetical protein
MIEPVKFDLASDLILIHRVVTRSLEVAVTNLGGAFDSREHESAGFRGFIMYLQCIITQMHEHHGNEDHVAFPRLRKLLPEEPYDLLMSQHRDMMVVVGDLEKRVPSSSRNPGDEQEREALLASLKRLREMWLAHRDVEEEHFGPDSISQDISMENRIRIGKASSNYAKFHSSPVSLMMPFLLYNLEQADREAMGRMMPGLFTKFLVPIVWRRRWEPMRPFLLTE